MNKLVLLPAGPGAGLESVYRRAFENATELYILSAYLTSWNPGAPLNSSCRSFRLIVGKDYGITRKQACAEVLKWIPKSKTHCFKVAAGINGYHPKAMFWKESGRMYALVGSSNLTEAAFRTNHEANLYQILSESQFDAARKWVRAIERDSAPVAGGWLDGYQEATLRGGGGGKAKEGPDDEFIKRLKLPRPAGAAEIVKDRRQQMKRFAEKRAGLLQLFRACASRKITDLEFYDRLPNFWSRGLHNRFQGAGFERQGKSSKFHQLAASLLRIVSAEPDERDDVVALEIDSLEKAKNTARTAFLSEMLCQLFPIAYPVLNKPVKAFLTDIGFEGAKRASEGAAYVHLAERLRLTLKANTKPYPARNLAELDAVIWLKYRPT